MTQLFIRSCSVLHDTIQTLGIYEATIDQEKRRKRSLTVVAANDLSTVLSSVDRRASYYRDKSRDEDAAASLASPSNRSIVSTLTEEDAEAWADGEHGLAEAAAFRFKQAYENFGIMSKHVNDFSEAWSFYFFFAEFILVIVVGFSGAQSSEYTCVACFYVRCFRLYKHRATAERCCTILIPTPPCLVSSLTKSTSVHHMSRRVGGVL